MALLLFEHNIVDDYKEIAKEDTVVLDAMNFIGANNRAGLSVSLQSKQATDEVENPIVADVVKMNSSTEMATKFIRQTVSSEYKKASDVINVTEPEQKATKKKSMKDLMNQSVFRGRGWIGKNFIA